jgi:hypothetical protein
MSKKMMSMFLTLLFSFPLGRLFVCLRIITINPALVTRDNPGQEGCIIREGMTKLLTDVDTLLLLVSCQESNEARYTTPNKRT